MPELAKKIIQRRRYQRYRLNKSAFQVLSHQHSFTGWGKDISKKGLAFKYTPYFVQFNDLSEIEIFLYDGYQYYFPAIACRVAPNPCSRPSPQGCGSLCIE